MAKSGLTHIDVGPELSRTEWESEETHELVHGTAFPGSPVERQLFYRDDQHLWYIYTGSAWVSLQATGSGDMTKAVYDTDDDGIVDNSEKLEGSTKAEVQDHTPKAHTLASHSTKAHTELTGVGADDHKGQKNSVELDTGDLQLAGDQATPGNNKVYGTTGVGVKGWKDDPAGGSGDMLKAVYDTDDDGVVDNSEKLEGSTKAEVQDHTPKAHTLASHSTKAHNELTGVGTDDHHAQVHDNADHSTNYASEADLTAHEAVETVPIHGSASAATASKLVHRDASGRAAVVNPAADSDIDTKGARNAAISTHAAAATAVHGVGGSTVESASGSQQKVDTHAALTVEGIHGSTDLATADKLMHRDSSARSKVADPAVDGDIDNRGARNTAIETHRTGATHTLDQPPASHGHSKHTALTLVDAIKDANLVFAPTASGWTEVLTGAGDVRQEPMRNVVEIDDDLVGSAFARAAAMGFNLGGNYGRINWDKEFYLIFNYAIYKTEASLVRRVQVWASSSTACKDLDAAGLGFRVENLAIVGESYGTARGSVSLGNIVVLTDPHYEMRQVVIRLDPDTPKVEFYLDGSLAASITNTDHIPSGVAASGCYLNHSITRPSSGAAGVASVFMQAKFWQEL